MAEQVCAANGFGLAEHMSHLNLGRYADWVSRSNDIERALADLRAGHYGLCDECLGEVELKVLEADPLARRCGYCQRWRNTVYGNGSGLQF